MVGVLYLSCVEAIDGLLEPLEPGWFVEFYGVWDLIYLLAHRSVACLSARDHVYVYVNQLFGGLDPYLLGRLAKILGGDLSRIYFSRGLRLEDLESFSKDSSYDGYLVVIDPYLHADPGSMGFEIYTKITSWIRRIGVSRNVVLFNRITRYGSQRPEGGGFHHHSVHIMIRILRKGVGIYGELIKHPARPSARAVFSIEDLYGGGGRWVGRRHLLEWALRAS
ncbi:MAG: hypothetical protein QXQ57_05450 [Sulfolobales archaeon]